MVLPHYIIYYTVFYIFIYFSSLYYLGKPGIIKAQAHHELRPAGRAVNVHSTERVLNKKETSSPKVTKSTWMNEPNERAK